MANYVKEDTETLDYVFDFTPKLDTGETITAAAVTAAAGLTVDSTSNTTTAVTVRISGGAGGGRYTVECQVNTSVGRVRVLHHVLRVTDRSPVPTPVATYDAAVYG